MAYSYGFDDESPRFTLSSLWFLVGVVVFAFAVLAMTAIVTGGPDRGYYLNVDKQPSQQAKPAVANAPRDPASTSPARRRR